MFGKFIITLSILFISSSLFSDYNYTPYGKEIVLSKIEANKKMNGSVDIEHRDKEEIYRLRFHIPYLSDGALKLVLRNLNGQLDEIVVFQLSDNGAEVDIDESIIKTSFKNNYGAYILVQREDKNLFNFIMDSATSYKAGQDDTEKKDFFWTANRTDDSMLGAGIFIVDEHGMELHGRFFNEDVGTVYNFKVDGHVVFDNVKFHAITAKAKKVYPKRLITHKKTRKCFRKNYKSTKKRTKKGKYEVLVENIFSYAFIDATTDDVSKNMHSLYLDLRGRTITIHDKKDKQVGAIVVPKKLKDTDDYSCNVYKNEVQGDKNKRLYISLEQISIVGFELDVICIYAQLPYGESYKVKVGDYSCNFPIKEESDSFVQCGQVWLSDPMMAGAHKTAKFDYLGKTVQIIRNGEVDITGAIPDYT